MRSKSLNRVASLLMIGVLMIGFVSCTAAPTATPSPTATTAAAKPTAAPAATATTAPPTVAPTAKPTAAPVKPITIRLATWQSSTHHLIKNVINPLTKEMEEKTNGRVKFEIYYAEALVKAADQYAAVVSGLADAVAITAPSYTPGRFPLLGLFELPFLLPDDDYLSIDALNAVFPTYLAKEWDAKVLSILLPTTAYLGTKKKVTRMEDLKGLNIKVLGRPIVAAFTLMGASPVSVPSPEMYAALQRGTIDGATYPSGSWAPLKLHEVIKYRLKVGIYRGPADVMSFNSAFWKSLPPDVQSVLETVGAKGTRMAMDSYRQAALDEEKVLKAGGMEDNVLTADELARWKTTVRPAWDEYINELEGKGLPAKKVMDEILKVTAKAK